MAAAFSIEGGATTVTTKKVTTTTTAIRTKNEQPGDEKGKSNAIKKIVKGPCGNSCETQQVSGF